MTLEDLVQVAMASPPGSIVFAKKVRAHDSEQECFEVESINGEKPVEA